MSGNLKGDWAWNTAHISGYTYPADAHVSKRNTPPPRKRRARPTVPVLAAAIAVMIGAGLGVAALTAPGNESATALAATTTSTPAWLARTPAPLRLPDPYSEPGAWTVGTDIPPGRYRVIVTGPMGGYWARCSDAVCALSDGTTGMLANLALPPGAAESDLEILPTDAVVLTAGVRLIPS